MKILGRTITWWRIFGALHACVFLILTSPVMVSILAFMWASALFRYAAELAEYAAVISGWLIDIIGRAFRCKQVTEKVSNSVNRINNIELLNARYGGDWKYDAETNKYYDGTTTRIAIIDDEED